MGLKHSITCAITFNYIRINNLDIYISLTKQKTKQQERSRSD